VWLWGVAVAALVGVIFSAVSSADFIEHLDRQVHAIHCSFIPGAGQKVGDSGCRAVMMSPYSSLFRDKLWGGLPISLLALAVFAYLVFRAADFALRSEVQRKETGFLLLATALPVLMSAIYGTISAREIGALCKLCVGIYAASGAALLFAIVAHVKASAGDGVTPWGGFWARWFAEGVVYVALLAGVYVVFSPKSEESKEGCGTLVKRDDKSGVLIDFGGRGTSALAVLDPLCPACRAFDKRLEASGLETKLAVEVLLFPLDSSCNWMVQESLHPGACAVSEAMLCAPKEAKRMMDWAFQHQESLLAEGRSDERALRRRLADQFPAVRGCLGSPMIKNKLNKSLRFAVANALPVLTPQLFIVDKRLCDEDTDLGLEFTVTAMLERAGGRR